jgi:hypothetical protein
MATTCELKVMWPVHGTLLQRCIPRSRGIWAALLRPWLAAAIIGWGLIAPPILWAQSPKPTDYDVKAVYLYNFGRFVEWPVKATTAGAFNICVLGDDPFGPALDQTLARETIGNRSVAVRRISSPQASTDCQILFISSSEAHRLNKIIDTLDKSAVLTVSDIPQFAQHRGMIQFVPDGNRVRFEVNLNATQKAGLTLSSELLKVASAVRRDRD